MQPYTGSFSLNKDSNSPFWMVTFTGADGRKKRRSTKVPHAGGFYQGERITATQARKVAERVAYNIAQQEEEEYHAAAILTEKGIPPLRDVRSDSDFAVYVLHKTAGLQQSINLFAADILKKYNQLKH